MRTIDSTRAVAMVRAGLDALADVDVSLLPDQCVRDELLELMRALHQVGAQISARVAAFDARGLAELDGCRDVRAFLSAFARIWPHATKPLLARGRVLRQMPKLAAAAARGEVSAEHLRPILDLVDQLDLPTVAGADEVLAAVASTGSVNDVAAACRRIRDHVDPDGPPPPDPDREHERRYLSLTRRGEHVHVKGQLDLQGGAALITALDALMRPPTDTDDRTPTQRRADALGDLALRHLSLGDLPQVHGERPHLGLLITPRTLCTDPALPKTWAQRLAEFDAWYHANHHAGAATPPPAHPRPPATPAAPSPAAPPLPTPPSRPPRPPDPPEDANPREDANPPEDAGPPGPRPGPCRACGATQPDEHDAPWLNWIGEIPVALAQRIACDADVWRAVLDPATSLPLDVGRAYRTAPYWMRRALHARDRGCRFPGCEMPPQWTDAHHLDHWIRGGRTTVEALILLCRHHHRLVHEGRWRIVFDPLTGEVRVWRPDGTPYELGPSQPWTGPATRRAGAA